MDSRKFVIKQTLLILAGQAVCVAAMLGIFALLGKFDQKALLGGIFGGLIATLNFFFMAIAATIAGQGRQSGCQGWRSHCPHQLYRPYGGHGCGAVRTGQERTLQCVRAGAASGIYPTRSHFDRIFQKG